MDTQDMSLLHSTHRQVWLEPGGSGVLSLSERAGLGRAMRSLQRLQSLERTCTMHVEDRGTTTIQHGLHEIVDHADFYTRVSFIFASEVRRVHAFS